MATGGTENADSYDDAVAGRIHVLCHPCGRRPKTTTATNVCLTCQEHLCGECIDLHRVFKPGEHHITAISSQDMIQTPVDMKGMDACTEHGRVFQYHCKEHKILCCERCHIEMHKKCDNIFDINNLLTEVENIDVLKNIESTLVQVNEKVEHSDTAVKALTTRIDNLKKQIEKEEERTSAAKSVRTELKDVMALNNDIQARGTDLQRYIIRFILTRSHIKSLSKLEDLFKGEPDNTVIIKHAGTQTAEVEIRDVECETDNTTERNGTEQVRVSNIENENIQESTSRVKLVVPVFTANPIITLQELPTKKLKRIRGDKKWPFISSLDFLSDGRIVAIDHNNDKCLILGTDLQRLGSFDFDDKPLSVACFGSDQLSVSLSGPSIAILSTNKSNNIMLTKTISLPSYMNVDNITPFYNGSFVLSTFDDNKPVRIIDVNGVYTFFHFIAFPRQRYELDKCQCTFIASHNILAFTDCDENSVCIYNTQTGESMTVFDSKIEMPRGVCEGPNGSILVCCGSSVVQLTPRGDVLTSVDVGMQLRAVKVSKDWTQLAASSTEPGNHELRLFKILK